MTHFLELEAAEKSEEDDWEEIFKLLDPKDGTSDGRIDKAAFLEWLDTLNFQDTVTLEVKNGITRRKLRYLIEAADTDDNNFIEKEEFMELVQKHCFELEKIERNNLFKYMRIAAYAEEYRWWPPPMWTLITILLNVGIYVYHVIFFIGEGEEITISGPVPLCSALIFNSEYRYQAWRYITYSFVHGGLDHVLINMCLLILVGLSLEMSNAWWRVALVYTLGLLSGSLAQAVIKPGTFLAGASGGVYALASSHIASLLVNWRDDSLILRQRIRDKKVTSPVFGKIIRLGRVLVVMGILGVDLITGLTSYITGEENHTSYIAHGSGSIMGLLVGLVILENRRVQSWERWLMITSYAVTSAILLVLAILNIVYVEETSNTSKLLCDKFML